MSGALCVMLGAAAFKVAVSPVSVGGTGVGTVTTTQAMGAVVTDAVGAVTYAWTLDGDGSIFALSPTSQLSFFRRHNVVSSESYSAAATVTVTDSAGQTASATGTVNIVGSA